MQEIETLTAYKCKFKYILRGNPLYDEQKEKIKNGDIPEYKVVQFVKDFKNYTSNLRVSNSTDKAIKLSDETTMYEEKLNKWIIFPNVGKNGKPIKVIKKNTNKEYNFNDDAVALYKHRVFLYEKDDTLIIIFHRESGSGCKSIFLETANQFLKTKGIKLEMMLIIPNKNGLEDATPKKLILQYKKDNVSSDKSENIRKKKETVVQELGLNLEISDNNNISNILNKLKRKDASKDQIFASILCALGNQEYNDAIIEYKIKNRTKKVRWDDIERIMGIYDISDELHKQKKVLGFDKALNLLVDDYYNQIIETGVIDE